MNLDEINFDFDIGGWIKNITDAFFKTVRTIFTMFFNLPMWVKITSAILLILFVIGIAILTWKYRDEWQYVKY